MGWRGISEALVGVTSEVSECPLCMRKVWQMMANKPPNWLTTGRFATGAGKNYVKFGG
jgi:hypothetical protein